MHYRGLLLIVLIVAVVGAATTGPLIACTCLDATSVTMGYPVGSPSPPATMGVATPGEKEFECWASANPSCNTQDLAWTTESITGVTMSWTPNLPVGGNVWLCLQGLPSSNSYYGPAVGRWVKASVDGKYAYGHYRLFFTEKGTDHPGGGTPNWYYYWEQTPAKYGTHTYDSLNDGTGTTYFSSLYDEWRSVIRRKACEFSPAGCYNYAEGIDFYAHICRHEERHRLDMIDLWGASSPRDPANDLDGDNLPKEKPIGTQCENPLGFPYHANGYDPTLPATYADHFNYGGAAWSDGVKTYDWSRCGGQYGEEYRDCVGTGCDQTCR